MTSKQNCPIGIFDSGIGGLTVLKQIRQVLPDEDIVYFGDTAHLPYGTKSKETITRFSIDNVSFLETFNVKMVIVACNTATALSLDILKNEFSIPIIGVIEPGAKQALNVTQNGRIGVIGTKATIGSGSYEASLKALNANVKVYSEACPLFVPFVEEGWLDGEVVMKVAKTYLSKLETFDIDTLILGCTHYPLLSTVIEKTLGSKVKLVNSAFETAKAAKETLASLGLLRKDVPAYSENLFYVSDEPEPFRVLGERFLGSPIHSVAKVGDYVRDRSQR